jgi:ferrous iron transport protein B
VGQVLLRSLFDRTLFVLGRAVAVAAPAGLVIWLLGNTQAGGLSLLQHTAAFLELPGQLLGMDGMILLAFLLAFPANEIVIPIVLMTYLAQGSLLEINSLSQMRDIFIANDWTPLTAACTVLFSLFHWPCSTTLLTVHKETGSVKWTLLAAILPTAVGIVTCMLLATIVRSFT